MKTSGYYFTLIAREYETGKCYKVWADTTFKSFSSWDALEEGDTFTDVSIMNEPRKLLTTTNYPRKIVKQEPISYTQLVLI